MRSRLQGGLLEYVEAESQLLPIWAVVNRYVMKIAEVESSEMGAYCALYGVLMRATGFATGSGKNSEKFVNKAANMRMQI